MISVAAVYWLGVIIFCLAGAEYVTGHAGFVILRMKSGSICFAAEDLWKGRALLAFM